MTTDKHGPRPMRNDGYDAIVPDELLAASHRRAASRARTSRTLDRSTMRRRVLPTAVVTSVAIIGTGLANAFVGATVPTTSTTTTTAPADVSRQSALNAQKLARLSATLANDRRIVAALTSTAQNTSATAASISASISASIATATAQAAAAVARASAAGSPVGSPTSTQSPSTAAPARSVTGSPTTTSNAGAVTSTSAPPAVTTPVTTPVPPPAPVTTTTAPPPPPPPAAAPVTQATTGASGAG